VRCEDEVVSAQLEHEADYPITLRTQQLVHPDEVDLYDFFLRVSKERSPPATINTEQPPPQPATITTTGPLLLLPVKKMDVLWQGFVPAWSQQELARQYLSHYNPTAYVNDDNYMGHGESRENAIHLDLRAMTNLIPWTPSVSDLVSGLAGPPSNPDMALTVVEVPKSCWMMTIGPCAVTSTSATVAPPAPTVVVPVLSVLYCPMSDTGDNYPVAGVMLTSQYLPGRLAQVDLFTNVRVPTTLMDPMVQQQQQQQQHQHIPPPPDEEEPPHYAFLSIYQDLISYENSQAFLAGDYNVGPVQDMETLQHIPVFPGGIVGGGGAGWMVNDDDDDDDAMEEDEGDM
jgi:hypothetical protein